VRPRATQRQSLCTTCRPSSPDALDTSFGLACGLTGALTWGLVDSCATIASRRVGTLVTSTGMQLAALIMLVALCLVTGEPIPTAGPVVAQTVVIGLISAVGYLLTYQAFRLGPVAVVSPVISAYGGLSVVLAVVILGESLRPLQAWGVMAATIGIALSGIVLDRQWRRSRPVGRGVPFAVGALVIWAVTVVGLAAPIRELGWLPALTISRAASTVALASAWGVSLIRSRGAQRMHPEEEKAIDGLAAGGLADLPMGLGGSIDGHRRRLRVRLDRTASVLVVVMGWLDVLGFSVWSIGLAATTAWLAGITGSFGPIVSMTFGLVVLRERLHPNQWFGVVVVLSSIILIGAS
jgi:drug/metabolite transporter (DMT)-like permease